MASKRGDILDNIATTIAAITTAGLYNFNVGECTRGLKFPNEVPEDLFPAAYVCGADEESHNDANNKFRSDMTASVVGYLKVTDSADRVQLEKDKDKLIQDFRKALLVDPTRGGNAIFTDIVGVNDDKGSLVPYAMVEVRVLCQYIATFASA